MVCPVDSRDCAPMLTGPPMMKHIASNNKDRAAFSMTATPGMLDLRVRLHIRFLTGYVIHYPLSISFASSMLRSLCFY
jgi:hypothetical protein